jgi:acyl carrier protein
MTRDEITARLLTIFSKQFEIDNPGLDDDLRAVYDFDSIDAIELLREIELMLQSELTRDEKKAAMDISTINDIVAYVLALAAERGKGFN